MSASAEQKEGKYLPETSTDLQKILKGLGDLPKKGQPDKYYIDYAKKLEVTATAYGRVAGRAYFLQGHALEELRTLTKGIQKWKSVCKQIGITVVAAKQRRRVVAGQNKVTTEESFTLTPMDMLAKVYPSFRKQLEKEAEAEFPTTQKPAPTAPQPPKEEDDNTPPDPGPHFDMSGPPEPSTQSGSPKMAEPANGIEHWVNDALASLIEATHTDSLPTDNATEIEKSLVAIDERVGAIRKRLAGGHAQTKSTKKDGKEPSAVSAT